MFFNKPGRGGAIGGIPAGPPGCGGDIAPGPTPPSMVLLSDAFADAVGGAAGGALTGAGEAAGGAANGTPPSIVLLKDRAGSGGGALGGAAAGPGGAGAGATGAGATPPNPSIVCFKPAPAALAGGAATGIAGRAG
jgi:hypothetical protein